MKRLLSKTTAALCMVTALSPAIAMASDSPIKGNIRVVIGSKSTGGDTYQATSIITEALSKKLDANFKVDAVGSSAAFKTLSRISNGRTIMVFHDQSYLGHLYGKPGYDDIFADYTVGQTFAINPGNAYLVPKKSPYHTLQDVVDAAAKGTRVRVAIQPGGVSEIGYSALKNAVMLKQAGSEEHLEALNTGSQSDKNQALFDGLADVINGSVQANEQYTRLPADDQKAMRFLWLTARHDTIAQANENGLGETNREELLTFVEANVSVPIADGKNFTFDKEFFFLYNKKTDPKIIQAMDKALTEVFADGEVQKQLKKAFFVPDFRPAAESSAYLKEKSERYAKIINALQH